MGLTQQLPANDLTPWPLSLRVLFRLAFCYFVQFCFGSGHKTILEKLPGGRHAVQTLVELPYLRASVWLAVHLLHLSGPAAVPHGSGFADRALDWIAAGLMLAIAVIATAVWSVLDRKRKQYAMLWLWLRLLLRLTLVVGMLWYGSIMIFPIQIEHPSLAVLTEPVGNLSPLSLLWTTLGLNPWYERLCWSIEILCALLLLYRRTALLGALLAAFVMSNIVLFNFFFDVPVKLYASHLLLMAVVTLLPDVPALFRFFWSRLPAAPASLWVPPLKSAGGRAALLALESVFLLVLIKPLFSHAQYTHEAYAQRHPSALAGQWQLLPPKGEPLRTGNGEYVTDLFLEPSGRDTLRGADGRLWPGGSYDDHTVVIVSPLYTPLVYHVSQPRPDLLELTPEAPGAARLELARVPIPLHFRLFDRGLHLVNEWGFEQ